MAVRLVRQVIRQSNPARAAWWSVQARQSAAPAQAGVWCRKRPACLADGLFLFTFRRPGRQQGEEHFMPTINQLVRKGRVPQKT
ncbi:MAG: hypothetical protein ACREDU_08290, partial [Methylocella sp.]